MRLMSAEDRYDNQQEICSSVDRIKEQVIAFDRHVRALRQLARISHEGRGRRQTAPASRNLANLSC